MFVHRHLIISALLTISLLSLALPSTAVPGESHNTGTRTAEMQGSSLQLAVLGPRLKQQRASSAAEAAKIAKRRYGGKVLKVETVESGDGVRYRVKILQDNGRVKTVVISG